MRPHPPRQPRPQEGTHPMTMTRRDTVTSVSDGFLHRDPTGMHIHHNLNRAGILMPALRAARSHRSHGGRS
jgi:hypothetical protein